MEITSTRNSFRVDNRLLNMGGHGILYAVFAEAMICSRSEEQRIFHNSNSTHPPPHVYFYHHYFYHCYCRGNYYSPHCYPQLLLLLLQLPH